MEQFAEMLSADFRIYALPFYEKYDTLRKLETYFEQDPGQIIARRDLSVTRTNGLWCCKAAVLCVLEEWEKLRKFLDDTDLLSLEQKKRIAEHISD